MNKLFLFSSFASFAGAAFDGLYGLSQNTNLIYQNPSGSSIPIGKSYPYEVLAQQLSTIAENENKFFFVSFNLYSNAAELLGLDISTGNVVNNVSYPFADGSFIGVGQQIAYDPLSHQVICGGQTSNQTHEVGIIDPATGAYSNVATISSTYIDVLDGAVEYDPQSQTLLMEIGVNDTIDLVSINMQDGSYKFWGMNYTSGMDLESLNFDPVSGFIIGLGIGNDSNGNLVRYMNRFDAKNGVFEEIGIVSEFTIMSGGIAALDYNTRTLYWIGILSNATNPASAPLYLVGLDLDTAAVKSSAYLCSSDPVCPWALEYYGK
jgi:hypothetical protein